MLRAIPTSLLAACLIQMAGAQGAPSLPVPRSAEPFAGLSANPSAPTVGSLVDTAQLAGLRFPIHTAPDDEGAPYGTWGVGGDYKASFGSTVRFVPYLGGEYPTLRWLDWTTRSIRVGGRELLTEADRAAIGAAATPYRWERRIGPAVETWDVLVEGLAQSFVFAEPLPAGELTITGRFGTELVAEDFGPAHGTLEFMDPEGRRILTYGAATAIDAAGRRLPLTTELVDGTCHLRVPARWLQDAQWPVVVDPITRVSVVESLTTGAIADTDLVRDDVSDRIFVAYAKLTTGSDRDVFAISVDDNFNNKIPLFADVSTSSSSDNPAVAVTGGADRRFGLVYDRDQNFTANRRLRFTSRQTGSTTFSSYSFVPNPLSLSNYHDSEPDIGGIAKHPFLPLSGSGFMICWQRDYTGSVVHANTDTSSVWAKTLDVYGGSLGSDIPVGFNFQNSHDHDRPRIQQMSERGGSFLSSGDTYFVIAHEYYPENDIRWQIRARCIGFNNGGTVQPGVLISRNSLAHRFLGHIAGSNGRLLLGYTDLSLGSTSASKPTGRAGDTVLAQRITWTPGSSPLRGVEVTLVQRSGFPDAALVGITYDTRTDSHWLLPVRFNAGTQSYVRYYLTGFNGEVVSETAVGSTGDGTTHFPGGVAFDAEHSRFLLSSGTLEYSPTYRNKLLLRRLEYPTAAAPFLDGASCSTAQPDWSGSQQIGAEFSAVELQGAPPNTFAFLGAAAATQNLPLGPLGFPTGCNLLIAAPGEPGHLTVRLTSTNAGGYARVPSPLFPVYPGITVRYQWFHPVSGTDSRVLSTRRLNVPLAK